MNRPISKAAIVGIVFALFFLALIIYETFGQKQVECEICMEFEGRSKCLTVRGETEQQAMQTAKDNACSYITSGRSEGFRCGQAPPASVRCQGL